MYFSVSYKFSTIRIYYFHNQEGNKQFKKKFNTSHIITASLCSLKKIFQLLLLFTLKKIILYSTENYIQYPVINHNGKEYEEECMIRVTESLCCSAEINITL